MPSDDTWLNDEQQQLWRRWIRVTALMPAALNRELQADSGLSHQDFGVLVQLTDDPEGRVRVSDLARGLQWERSRLSHHLGRMARRGLVERQECPDDGRGAFIAVTAQGRAAIEQAAPGHVAFVRRTVFDHLDEQEVRVLDGVLQKMLTGLEAVAPDPCVKA